MFYGAGPDDPAAIARIKCPVHGFYGDPDARVTATVPKSEELMKAAGKKYEPVTYEGVGHGFMRAGEGPNSTEPNKRVHDEGWARWKAALKKIWAVHARLRARRALFTNRTRCVVDDEPSPLC